MSDEVIKAEKLTKVYRLYKRPVDRLLDAFGLLRGEGRYGQHTALDGIDLSIRRGEKVAIIGRNGAGKSTLLKIITGTIEPTAGSLEIRGATQALLQIGTGFHPEFSGRDNVISYLAQLGITGKRASELTADVIDFAEVEEYIDQPVKTYSTGMAARLMFAASTVIEPEVLVIDEVLGVGDAYFARKSYERIKALCAERNATLLLVSHDIYTASQICDRMIWIDRGRKIADGPCTVVMEAYERSIRRQEEMRLNRRAIVTLRQELLDEGLQGEVSIGRLADAGDVKGERPELWISHVGIEIDGTEIARIDAGRIPDAKASHIVLDAEKGNWGPVATHEGRQARRFEVFGSSFHRLPFAFIRPGLGSALSSGKARVVIGFHAAAPHELDCIIVHPELARLFGARIAMEPGGWRELVLPLTEDAKWSVAERRDSEVARYGSRRMEITDVQFIDATGSERHIFNVGEPLKVRLSYRINDPSFDERPLVVVAFQKDGTVRSHRFWHDGLHFGPYSPRDGVIEIEAAPHLVGAGRYMVTTSLFREGYMTSAEVHGFFAYNPGVLDMRSRGYEFIVSEDAGWRLFNDAIFQHPSVWRVDGVLADQPDLVKRRGLIISGRARDSA